MKIANPGPEPSTDVGYNFEGIAPHGPCGWGFGRGWVGPQWGANRDSGEEIGEKIG